MKAIVRKDETEDALLRCHKSALVLVFKQRKSKEIKRVIKEGRMNIEGV